MSGIYYPCNFSHNGLGVWFPHIRDFAHQFVYSAISGFFLSIYSQDTTKDIDANGVKRCGSAQHGCAFSGP